MAGGGRRLLMRHLTLAIALLESASFSYAQVRAEDRDGKVFLTNESPVALAADDIDVLHTAIGSARIKKVASARAPYLLADRTLSFGGGCNWIGTKGLSPEALREISARNEGGKLLPRDVLHGVRLVEEWRVPAWFGWEKVATLYPGATALLRVGLPGYTMDRQGCIIVVEVLSARSSQRVMLLLQRVGEQWAVTGEADASCVFV
jgi:hypothetical protein